MKKRKSEILTLKMQMEMICSWFSRNL